MAGRVLLILDFYHVVMRIREGARLLYADGTEQYRKWSGIWCDSIREGGAVYVMRQIAELAIGHKHQAELDELAGYLSNNLDRMRYDEYAKRGLQYSSAPVESANFHMTGARLKQQGMRWSAADAGEMAVLRADLCNGHWADRTRQLLKLAA